MSLSRLVPFLFVFAVATIHTGTAQVRGGRCYPMKLYMGENIITVSDPAGIQRITFTNTPRVSVSMPVITGCPTSLDIPIRVLNATTGESVDLVVYNCAGRFTAVSIPSENWTIRNEETGAVTIGTDTCLECEIRSTDDKLVDSIAVSNPDVHIEMPPHTGKTWQVYGGVIFNYRICYRPKRTEILTEMIRLYVRRAYPNGGLEEYMIEKPIELNGVPPYRPGRHDDDPPPIPPLTVTDPTTYSNIMTPTAESVGRNRFFVANYEIAGWLLGYGLTDRLSLFAGGALVPDFIGKLQAVVAAGKYEVLTAGKFNLALGGVYAFTSTKTSDITTKAGFGVVSYGDRQSRVSLGVGYSWKHHESIVEIFDRKAAIASLSGDMTVARGWKLAAEGYYIESSGIAPGAVTAKYFTDRFALNFGLGINFAGGSTGSATAGPVLSATWVW